MPPLRLSKTPALSYQSELRRRFGSTPRSATGSLW